MRTFTDFLIEKNMKWDDALQILGLKPEFTKAEFDTRYKELVRANHPDRGGDTRKMADINSAADTIRAGASGVGKAAPGDRAQERRDWDEKKKALMEVVKKSFTERFDINTFRSHFDTVFGEPFTAQGSFYEDRYGGLNTAVVYRAKFTNDASTIAAEMSVYIDVIQLMNARALSNPEDFLNMSITTEILVNRKKIKLTQRDWQMRKEGKVLENPDTLFPASKLKAQTQKSTGRAMKKADVLLTFKQELGADVDYQRDAVWAMVPVGKYRVALYRTTMSFRGARASMWHDGGIYEKHGRKVQGSTGYLYETEAGMHFLYDELKDMQKSSPETPEHLHKQVEQMFATAKARYPLEG